MIDSPWYATPDWYMAGFTFLLFIATAGLWFYTGRMWRATRDLTLLSVKRPWLFISGPFQLRDDRYEDEIWTFTPYSIVNHGEAPAIIEDVQCDFIRDITESPLGVVRSNELIVNPIIGPAEARANLQAIIQENFLGEESLLYMANDTRARLPAKDVANVLMLRIRIQYRGVSTKGHESSGLWRWNSCFCQFEVTGGEKENFVR